MKQVFSQPRFLLRIGRFVVLRSRYWGVSGGRGELSYCLLLGMLAFYWLHRRRQA